MHSDNHPQPIQHKTPWRPGCLTIGLIILVTVVISTVATVWILNNYIFPKRFDPVQLSRTEQQALDDKIGVFNQIQTGTSQNNTGQSKADGTGTTKVEPEQYDETNANRVIRFSERELNALLANNTDLSDQFAIDLSDNLASGKLLVTPEPDFPIFGGKTVKLSAGLELSYQNNRPIVKLRGVSVMGVPIPNAWLGGLKNVDLIDKFGADEGVWQAFADGVELIVVEDQKLVIKLKE